MLRPLFLILIIGLSSFFHLGAKSLKELMLELDPVYIAEMEGRHIHSLFGGDFQDYYYTYDSQTYFAKLNGDDRTLRLELISNGPGMFIYQFKLFESENGSPLVLIAKMGSARGITDVIDLHFLSYNSGTWKEMQDFGLQKSTDTTWFISPSFLASPESKSLELNPSYQFKTDNANSIIYEIEPRDDQLDPHILRRRVYFIWDGRRFHIELNP